MARRPWLVEWLRPDFGTLIRTLVQAEEEVEKRKPTIQNILALPNTVIGNVLDFLIFAERRNFFVCGSRFLWETLRIQYESEMMSDLVLSGTPSYSLLCENHTNVCNLNLGRWSSDVVLALLSDARALPNLKHLSMASSVRVTDEGLVLLTQNPVRCQTLETLEITYCRRTSYGATLVLRDKLKVTVIRRQPEWMDGVTSYGDGTSARFADGSFLFYNKEGGMELCGYFCDLFEYGFERRVVCKQQYAFSTNFENDAWWQSQSEWMQHAYHLGSTFLYLPSKQATLKAFPARGIYPVFNYPQLEHADTVQHGCWCPFDQQGRKLRQLNDPQSYAVVEHANPQRPLDAPMPPPEIVEFCRTQVQNMPIAMAGMDQVDAEKQAHIRCGGNANDEPPPEWFQYYS